MKAEVSPRNLRLAVGVDTVANLAKQYPKYRFAVNGCYFGPQMQVWSPLAKDGKLLCPHYVDRGHPYLAVQGHRAWFGRGIPDAKGVDFALGGGPMLLKNGKTASKVAGENYDAEVSAGETRVRNRTVAGITPKGTVVVLALNGTFGDCRKALLDAGCTEGMNLDGGSSTQWVENGVTVYGTPRKVVSALVAMGDKPFRVYISASHQWENIGQAKAYGGSVKYSEGYAMQMYALAQAAEVKCEVQLSDYNDTLSQVCAEANAFGADLFIENHTNACNDPKREGCEIYILARGGNAERFALILQKQFAESKVPSTIKVGDFQVLRDTKMPAVLIEHNYHTNSAAVLKFMEPTNMLSIAWDIAQAIDEYAHKG